MNWVLTSYYINWVKKGRKDGSEVTKRSGLGERGFGRRRRMKPKSAQLIEWNNTTQKLRATSFFPLAHYGILCTA